VKGREGWEGKKDPGFIGVKKWRVEKKKWSLNGNLI
jgi:hypothetical protein